MRWPALVLGLAFAEESALAALVTNSAGPSPGSSHAVMQNSAHAPTQLQCVNLMVCPPSWLSARARVHLGSTIPDRARIQFARIALYAARRWIGVMPTE